MVSKLGDGAGEGRLRMREARDAFSAVFYWDCDGRPGNVRRGKRCWSRQSRWSGGARRFELDLFYRADAAGVCVLVWSDGRGRGHFRTVVTQGMMLRGRRPYPDGLVKILGEARFGKARCIWAITWMMGWRRRRQVCRLWRFCRGGASGYRQRAAQFSGIGRAGAAFAGRRRLACG